MTKFPDAIGCRILAMLPARSRRLYCSAIAMAAGMEAYALACSGPGALAHILRAERLGWMLWGATLLVAGGSAFIPRFRARGWRRQWPLMLLVALHPGWWMSARSGDCGCALIEGSVLVTALTPLAVGFLFWRLRVPTASTSKAAPDKKSDEADG